MEKINNNIKILLLGNSSVGKTTIVDSFIHNEYDDNITPTIGLDYKSKIIYNTNIQLYDTSGQERFKVLVNSYYRYANIVMFIFSLDNIKTLEDIENIWIPNTNNFYNQYKKPYYILVGNKSDKNLDEYILHKLKEIKNKFDIDYYEVSARTLYNIDYLFQQIYKNYTTNNKYILVNTKDNKDIIKLDNQSKKKTSNKIIDDDYVNNLCCVII